MKDNETVLGLSKFEKILIILIPMVLGGLIGWFIPTIADWILKLPVVPMEKLILLITSFNNLWVSIVATVLGIIVGVLLTFIIFDESLEVTLSNNSLQLKLGDNIETIEKKDISVIYMENKQLIILGQNSEELYREVFETRKETVRQTLLNYQYPWKEKDPFYSHYQRWVLGHPDFPEKINALLYAREFALKENKKENAKYLRKDLAKLGVVIRDERNGQYARLIKGAK
ncbi:YqeB family protein [Bacillus pseudomycoides]|uniref:YqeB family protein n=1 Tax=Bacillus pseudomycoides TaxID=64104 RepID=UPI000BEDF385|nr:50S ribosomal protein L29 [Bacillus pseudomycoides]PEE39676.1 50S ribosomal protein L29 [Bacillus pseudomycoides]PGA86516.1 50S ribosomal protein L29 [Bacillus pseudomycoides]PHF40376.1 50S ribosomal protein L29 [Bacillus pseudomycoides]